MSTKFSKAAATGAVVLYLVLIFQTSFSISATCLQDPDTCWLLAMGREIWTTKEIPRKDPFSHTIPAENRPQPEITAYQWLSELTIYGVYRTYEKFGLSSDYSISKSADLSQAIKDRTSRFFVEQKSAIDNLGLADPAAVSLLCLTSLLIGCAFVVFPLWITPVSKEDFLYSFLTIWLGLSASAFHFYLRPEVFSYFFLSILLSLLFGIRMKIRNAHGDNKLPLKSFTPYFLGLFVLMLLWSNFHSGFVTAIVLLILMAVTGALEKSFSKSKNSSLLYVSLISILVALIASFINPFGLGLIQYLPHLFFGSSNSLIEELKPLTFFELFRPSFFPFGLLSVFALVTMLTAGLRLKEKNIQFWTSSIIVILAIVIGFACRRLIPFVALVVVFELLYLRFSHGIRGPSRFKGIDSVINKWTSRRVVPIMATIGLVLVSAFLQARAFVPRIPQISYAFYAPFDGLAYLQKHKPKANLFNDPQFGDMMIWHLYPTPKVFIDTRFDSYGDRLVIDSWKIESCQGNWRKLLENYGIGSVFVPSNSMLAEKLKSEPMWNLVFKDNASMIFEKRGESIEKIDH